LGNCLFIRYRPALHDGCLEGLSHGNPSILIAPKAPEILVNILAFDSNANLF